MVAASVQQHGEQALIYLGLRLPDTHGVSGIRELKLRYPNVPMVVLTASAASDYEDLAINAGADAFIKKSAGATEITRVLRVFFEHRTGRRNASAHRKIFQAPKAIAGSVGQRPK